MPFIDKSVDGYKAARPFLMNVVKHAFREKHFMCTLVLRLMFGCGCGKDVWLKYFFVCRRSSSVQVPGGLLRSSPRIPGARYLSRRFYRRPLSVRVFWGVVAPPASSWVTVWLCMCGGHTEKCRSSLMHAKVRPEAVKYVPLEYCSETCMDGVLCIIHRSSDADGYVVRWYRRHTPCTQKPSNSNLCLSKFMSEDMWNSPWASLLKWQFSCRRIKCSAFFFRLQFIVSWHIFNW